jgi:hypothetical protein
MESVSTDGVIDVSNQQPLEEISTGLPLFEKGDVLFAKITPWALIINPPKTKCSTRP